MPLMRPLSPVPEPLPEFPKRANLPLAGTEHDEFAYAAAALVAGYRAHGYRAASIDPLAARSAHFSRIAELDPRYYGLLLDDSLAYPIELAGSATTCTLSELLARLQASYCGSLTLECGHVRAEEQQRWLWARMEALGGTARLSDAEAMRVLASLVAAEAFEHYQRATYPKHKQYSLEGSESFVPLLEAVVETAAEQGVEELVLGMPHRGRLNVVANVFELPPARLFSLFSGRPDPSLAAEDLKDHLGCSMRKRTGDGEIELVLLHNPSHLEAVSPVVCGMSRALQDRKADGSSRKVLPVLVHGDASFSGQGIVAETLNLAQTRGYGVGGTLHLILNNQIGSTVSHPRDQRSTLYCADVARAFDAPILHVNGDDPEAVVAAARVATEFRVRFGADVVVDHVSYRRPGHFGGDDPTMTRPATQRKIRNHRSVVDLYAAELASRGVDGARALDDLKAGALSALSAAGSTPLPARTTAATSRRAGQDGGPVHTAVPAAELRNIAHHIMAVPRGFALHAGIQALLDGWRKAVDEDGPVDWHLAENLAYGSLLANGFNVRLTGLDVGRGSFFHRQHVWHDQAAEIDWQNLYVPLRHIAPGQGHFSIFESVLSEEAVLGFEYGYTLRGGRDLVLWEAQFGDFVNNAQVIIDQFIATGEAKWGYQSGLVALLPHGYEGTGSEHSSAYLGRFLQLCADDNLQVAMPSTAAQLYHLLRRQALTARRKPLIVMTPKWSLYAQQASFSRFAELADGAFQPLLGEGSEIDAEAVTRVVVTSGKLYYDIASLRLEAGLKHVPILRLEQLYPIPGEALRQTLGRFRRLREVVWAQEEAKNHGAWYLLREQLEAAAPPGAMLSYSGRSAMAPTAGCDAVRHATEQLDIARRALGVVAA
ncbi:MAG: 2-oxoglutarate dehydrogenase E1 component [Betaproteobacteria bacterium]|nr:MAG: 2-oxoglutarate dehydrogenase E1 component [Betaproteobacteria bacterium]